MGITKIRTLVDGVENKVLDFNDIATGLASGSHTITVEAYDGATLVHSETKNINVASSSVSEYPFTETTGDAIDIIGSHNGSVFGSMVRSGTEYEFNGSNTYVQVPDNDDHSFVDESGDLPFTIEIDIKFKSFQDGWIISRRTSGSSAQEYQLICLNNTIALYLFQGGGSTVQIGRSFPTSELSTNTWYKLKATSDGSLNRTGIQLLVDDVRKDTTDIGSASYTGMANTAANTHIGNYTPGLFYFDGFMKNIKIYKGVVV